MANIEQIRLPDGVTHDIKDHTIRDEVKYKIYNSVTDLGLTSGSATISGAYSAMPDCSMLVCNAIEFIVGSGGVPEVYGIVEITKNDSNRTSIIYRGKTGVNDYRMFCDLDTGEPTGVWSPFFMHMIWNNPNPTATFGAQAVSVDMTPYRFAMIAFLASASERQHVNTITYKSCWGRAEALLNVTWNSTVIAAASHRAYLVYSDNSGIYFENCAVRGAVDATSAPQALDTCLIPQYIVGIP